MKLVTNNITSNNNYYTKKQNNVKNINNTQVKFKGYTIGPIPILVKQGYCYSGDSHIDGYKVPPEATPNYEGAYPNKDTKIYKADPFEIIPEEKYKTHDYTIRDDLRLSQIKKDYKNNYYNFASNAWNEKTFLESKENISQKNIDTHNHYIDEYKKRIDFTDSDYAKSKYAEKTLDKQNQLKRETEQKNIIVETLKNANERFNLLKELDDKKGEQIKLTIEKAKMYSKIQHNRKPYETQKAIQEKIKEANEINDIIQNDNYYDILKRNEDIAMIKAKYQVRIGYIKKKITSYCQDIASGKAEIPSLEKNVKY